MDRAEDVHNFIGIKNYKLIREAIKDGELDKTQVQLIGRKIKKNLNGVFKREYQPGIDLRIVWDKMLDAWVKDVEDITDMGGAVILKNALMDCEERGLAGKIQLKPENGKLESEIPTSHPKVPEYILSQDNKTAKPPSVTLP